MILISTPTNGLLRAQYFLSIYRSSQEMSAARVRHRIHLIDGVSPISFARAEAVAAFIESEDATHLMMIDDDMVFTAADIIALKAAEKPVVGALCPLRVAQSAYNAEPSGNPEKDGELVTVDALGAGFMMVERSVIEEWIAETEPLPLKSGAKRWMLFDTGLNPKGIPTTEDYMFCHRVRERGHKVWVHTGLDIGHVGTHEFHGRHTGAQKLELLQGAWSE